MKFLTYKLPILALLLIMTVACDDFDEKFYVNPNNTTTVLPETLLTNSLRSVSGVISAGIPIQYAQQFSQTQYTDGSRYADVNFNFNGWYIGPLADLNHIIELNTDEATRADAQQSGSNANQIAVARIMKAYFFHFMTDSWGPLPYSQALLGRDNFRPAYDSQQDIYMDLFRELKEANAQMDGGLGVQGDFLFDGDMDQWRRFANSIRMIMALRISNVDPGTAQSEFVDAMNAGVLETNLLYPYLAEANNQNPWFGSFITRTDWAISDVMVDYMKPLGDPRLNIYADPAPNFGEVMGMPYGIVNAGDIPNADVSFPGFPAVRGQNAPIPILTHAQLLFSMSEAALKGWISEDAGQLYADAIRASMAQWGVTDEAAIEAFLSRPEVAWDEANGLEQIGNQKWVALYLQGYEAWNEWRRLGIPNLMPPPEPLNPSRQIPRRYGYPTSERDLNATNYNNAVNNLLGGPDQLSTRLWWDVE